MWSNKTLFSHVSLKAIDPSKPLPAVDLPGVTSEGQISDAEEEDDEEYVSVDQLSKDLITMTSLASSRWQNLLDIELVKKRNKPKEPPKVTEAPFFLPTVSSLETRFDFSDVKTAEENSKIIVPSEFQNLSPFGKLLFDSVTTKNFGEPIKMLKRLGPGSIDIEIKNLDLGDNQTTVMMQFLKMLRFMFKSRVDFELAQAYLAVFVKNHGPAIVEKEELKSYLKRVEVLQTESWNLIKEKLLYNLSVVQHLKTL